MGHEDDEHPAVRPAGPTFRLQRRLTDIIDRRIATALAQSLGQAGRWPDVRRLREISDPDCSHEWLWQHFPETSPVLSSLEYVTAVRLRLGAAGPDEPPSAAIVGCNYLMRRPRTHFAAPTALPATTLCATSYTLPPICPTPALNLSHWVWSPLIQRSALLIFSLRRPSRAAWRRWMLGWPVPMLVELVTTVLKPC